MSFDPFDLTDLTPYIQEVAAWSAFMADPDSDPALIFTVEEHYGVTFE